MGKSTIAGHFRSMGCPVFDADACVHTLYGVNGGAVEPLRAVFPSVIVDNAVDRRRLSQLVLNAGTNPGVDNDVLIQLEAVVHPLVETERLKFLNSAAEMNCLFVVYDVPLLLEKKTGWKPGAALNNITAAIRTPQLNAPFSYIEEIFVASARQEIQQRRVLARGNMNEEMLALILSKQMPDADKRRYADFIIDTSYERSTAPAKAQVANAIETLLKKPKHAVKWDSFKKKTTVASVPSTTIIRTSADPKTSSTSLSRHAQVLKEKIDYVLFDLDDTLAPTQEVVANANTHIVQHLLANGMPRTAQALLDGTVSELGTRYVDYRQS
jgi:dephospho-CoA kinase